MLDLQRRTSHGSEGCSALNKADYDLMVMIVVMMMMMMMMMVDS